MTFAHARVFADYLESRRKVPGSPPTSCDMAEAIIADPQSHVDALVAAGVLEPSRGTFDGAHWYRVVAPEPPHVHDWRCQRLDVTGVSESPLVAHWSCRSCPETATTDIEPPK